MLLELFEKHYIPLQGELRPVMRAFILALLPGLEEETSGMVRTAASPEWLTITTESDDGNEEDNTRASAVGWRRASQSIGLSAAAGSGSQLAFA